VIFLNKSCVFLQKVVFYKKTFAYKISEKFIP